MAPDLRNVALGPRGFTLLSDAILYFAGPGPSTTFFISRFLPIVKLAELELSLALYSPGPTSYDTLFSPLIGLLEMTVLTLPALVTDKPLSMSYFPGPTSDR